jgi:Protein of unknown function (DUF1360)
MTHWSGRAMDEANFWIRFVLAVLATWRVTHLLANEDGPKDIIVRIRRLLDQNLFGALMDCFNCLSLWIAVPAALFVTFKPINWLFSWLAISGAACLLQRMIEEPVVLQPAPQTAEGDSLDVLRSETHAAQELANADTVSEPPSILPG